MTTPPSTSDSVESALGRMLTAMILVSAGIATLGAVLFLLAHGRERIDLAVYHPQAAPLTSPAVIASDAMHLNPAAVIQLGVLLLILTPIVRVASSLLVFMARRDGLYILITLVVLAVLLAGLLGGVA